ncbi:MAG: MFS transporter [Pyrinomonadaceae bacterium]
MALLSKIAVDITPLRISRDYRLLFFGQLISFFGTMMTFIVVPVQMFELTGSSLKVGLLGLAEFVPMFSLAFVGGALADSIDRRKMLRVTEVGQLLTTLLLLGNALLPAPTTTLLYVAVGVHAGLAGLQRPSFEALIAKLVPPEHMSAVAALNALRFEIGFIIAPVLGGYLAARHGASWAYVIDVVTFAASLAAVFMISASAIPKGAGKASVGSVVEGFKYAIKRQELLGTYVVDINAMFFGMPKALFPALAVSLGRGTSVGLYYSALAVGALAATMTSGWTKSVNRHGLMIALAAGGWGVAIAIFGLVPGFYLGLFFVALAGFFDMISGIFRTTVWNQTVPDRFRGRLAGIEMISFMTGPLLGDAESGIVAYFTDVRTSIVSGGVLAVIGTIVLAILLPRFISYDGREGLKQKRAEDKAAESLEKDEVADGR